MPVTQNGGNYGQEVTGATEVANIQATVGVGAGTERGWYYNYNPTTAVVTPGVDFVPMFWDASYMTGPNVAAAATYPWILGFNEPDLPSIGNMTVGAALAAWPTLEATGRKLVSPSCSCDMSATSGTWFARFMNGDANANDVADDGPYRPRVDAIAVHKYNSNFGDATGNALLTYVGSVSAAWGGRKIWVTEFSEINFTGATSSDWLWPTQGQAISYAQNTVLRLRKSPLVDRFSWYPNIYSASGLSPLQANAANDTLGNPDGTLTPLGTVYSGLDLSPRAPAPAASYAWVQGWVLPQRPRRRLVVRMRRGLASRVSRDTIPACQTRLRRYRLSP